MSHYVANAHFAGLEEFDDSQTKGVPHGLENLCFQAEPLFFFLIRAHVLFSIFPIGQILKDPLPVVKRFLGLQGRIPSRDSGDCFRKCYCERSETITSLAERGIPVLAIVNDWGGGVPPSS
jgi:hypothetical protein